MESQFYLGEVFGQSFSDILPSVEPKEGDEDDVKPISDDAIDETPGTNIS